jgi:hypothetical protein
MKSQRFGFSSDERPEPWRRAGLPLRACVPDGHCTAPGVRRFLAAVRGAAGDGSGTGAVFKNAGRGVWFGHILKLQKAGPHTLFSCSSLTMTRLATGRGNGGDYLENTIAKKPPDSGHSGTAQRDPESRDAKHSIVRSAKSRTARLWIPGSARAVRNDVGWRARGVAQAVFENAIALPCAKPCFARLLTSHDVFPIDNARIPA